MKKIMARSLILAVLGSVSCMGFALADDSDALNEFSLSTLFDDDSCGGAVYGPVAFEEFSENSSQQELVQVAGEYLLGVHQECAELNERLKNTVLGSSVGSSDPSVYEGAREIAWDIYEKLYNANGNVYNYLGDDDDAALGDEIRRAFAGSDAYMVTDYNNALNSAVLDYVYGQNRQNPKESFERVIERQCEPALAMVKSVAEDMFYYGNAVDLVSVAQEGSWRRNIFGGSKY